MGPLTPELIRLGQEAGENESGRRGVSAGQKSGR